MSLSSPPPASTQAYLDAVSAAAASVVERVGSADVAVVLGSGLNNFVTHLEGARALAYSTVPGMPQTTVAGHDGKIVVGALPPADGDSDRTPTRLMCFAGRVHLYEGWQAYQLHFITRLAARAGCRLIVFTNSAGGALPDMGPGSIMCIRDILRVTNVDPMAEIADDARFGPRGLQTQGALSDRVAEIAREVSRDTGVPMYEGTYAWFSGPTYETHAEVQAGLRLGVGAFGMSTVPEIMAARALGMEVFALSLATNMAAGLADEKLLHEDVVRVGREAGPKFERLLLGVCRRARHALPPADATAAVSASPAPAPGAARALHPRAPWQFAAADVVADALALGGDGPLAAAVFLGAGHDAALAALGEPDGAAVPLREALPRFGARAAQTASALHGSLTVVRAAGGARVAVVHGARSEGLARDEAAFLVAVLARRGASRVLQSLVAGPAGDGAAEGLLLVSDTISRASSRAPLFMGAAASGRRRREGPAFDPALIAAARAAPAAAGAAAGALTAYPGPTLPTACEQRSAAPECAAVTVTSVAPCESARALGTAAFCVAAVTPDFFRQGAADARAASSAADVGAVLAAALAGAAPAAADVPDAAAGEGAPAPPLLRPSQENYEHVAEAAAAACAALGIAAGDASAALVLEGYEGLVALDRSVPCHELPHWTASGAGGPGPLGARWTVGVGAAPAGAAGRAVYLLAPEPDAACGGPDVPPAHELGFGARMLHLMGVRAVLMAPRVTSVTSAVPVGATVLVRDHINLTGSNPLMGLNDGRWGVRFPDMGSVYTAALREAMGGGGGGAADVACAITTSAAADSRAEADFLARLGAGVVCTGAVPEAIRLGHSQVAVAMLGVVTQSAVADAASPYRHPAELDADQRRAVLGRLAEGVAAAASL